MIRLSTYPAQLPFAALPPSGMADGIWQAVGAVSAAPASVPNEIPDKDLSTHLAYLLQGVSVPDSPRAQGAAHPASSGAAPVPIGPLVLKNGDRIRGIIDRYFERLRELSDPPDKCDTFSTAAALPDNESQTVASSCGLWSTAIAFPTNEPKYVSAFDESELSIRGIGGAYIGTGAGLFLSHMYYQRASQGYVVDHNRLVTEAVIPAIGILLMEFSSPAAFLSRLASIPLTPAELAFLEASPIETIADYFARDGITSDASYLQSTVDAVCDIILPHIEPEARGHASQKLRDFFNSLRAMLPRGGDVTQSASGALDKNALPLMGNDRQNHSATKMQGHFNLLQTSPPDKRYPTSTHVRRQCIKYLSMIGSNGTGGPLSSLDAFGGARRLWFNEVITGVSADFRGGVLQRIGQRLAAQTATRVIYLSNAMDHMGWDWHTPEGREGMAKFVGDLAGLPADEKTVAIVAELGSAATRRYGYADLVNILRVDAEAGEDFLVVRDLMSALARHKGAKLDVMFFGFEQAHLKAHRLGAAIGKAITERKTITEARLKEIAAECSLSPGDLWRLIFTMRELGIGDKR